ncbi:MAG TPA: nucleoside kinase [Candidatus Alistipes pullicola]|nr:nucleoside kinase [Candidatus Alistipes pullicola]
MTETVKIYCENTNSHLFVQQGTSLMQVAEMLSIPTHPYAPLLACYVNNRLRELNFKIYTPLTLRFIDITHFEGMRVYQRTLFFILYKAVHDLYPERILHIKHAVAKGFYCEIEGMEDISDEELGRVRNRMQDIINQNIPIVRNRITFDEAIEILKKNRLDDKLSLLETRPHLYVSIYNMADVVGYFYGVLAISTGYIHMFDIHKYYKGFRIATPQRTDPSHIEEEVPQNKMFEVFNEYNRWVEIIGVANIGALNEKILDHKGGNLLRIAESLHEKSVGYIADRIAERHKQGKAKIVLISGPSSSGKTTFAKRLGIQLSIWGLDPVLISLDDYFIDREKTPRDENGEYDFEALEAIDVPMFNDHLNRLIHGEEIDMPRYNFISGKREFLGRKLKMKNNSVLVIEGIHGLNPKLTPQIEADMKFKIYVSALTSISIDNLNRVATTDNRLIRRIVRDYRTRGNNATDTLRRWESVRRGEDKHIFPNQEQADMIFNSSLFYELAVLKDYVRPLLREVPDTTHEFGEARRLLKFLDLFTAMDGKEIPPTSILREFIGGSAFEY